LKKCDGIEGHVITGEDLFEKKKEMEEDKIMGKLDIIGELMDKQDMII
jgi:hypothetical protein